MAREDRYRSIFILGGARSGKSALAQRLAAALSARVLFVATAWPSDDEMAVRIARHRADRPPDWRLIERPSSFGSVVEALSDSEVILFDSLSLWLADVLTQEGSTPVRLGDDFERSLRRDVTEFYAACRSRCHLVIVSDEVGMGLVPQSPGARQYSDLLGALNQASATAAATVLVVIAGLPMLLKGPGIDAAAAPML